MADVYPKPITQILAEVLSHREENPPPPPDPCVGCTRHLTPVCGASHPDHPDVKCKEPAGHDRWREINGRRFAPYSHSSGNWGLTW